MKHLVKCVVLLATLAMGASARADVCKVRDRVVPCRTDAEEELQSAIRVCSGLVGNQASKATKDSYGAEWVERQSNDYRAHRDKALSLDQAVKKTTWQYSGNRPDDDGIAADPRLIKLTLSQLAAYCDIEIPKTLAIARADAKRMKAQDKAEAKEQNAIKDADEAMKKRGLAKLKGDRKRLQNDRGWPNQTSSGDDDYDTDKSYTKVAGSKWWMYGSMENRNGEWLCFEYFDFKGDKIAKRRTRGICH